MSKSSLRILPALLVAIAAALITQTVRGQAAAPTATPVITFTERSDTNLTAVYTNGAGVTTNLIVTPTAPGATDSWFVFSSPLFTAGTGSWFEPSSTNFDNFVSFFSPVQFVVRSDAAIPPGTDTSSFLANGDMTAFPIATDVSNPGSPVDVYGIFNDRGDAPAGVPDTGTTASLFGFSLAGLAFLRRKLA